VNELIIITGPTAVGKTDLAIRLAQHWKTEILSCDSRQIYKEMKIGTAVPEPSQLEAVPHHFIANISIHDYYSVFQFEQQAIALLDQLFLTRQKVVMTGGSGLYMDCIINGIDDIPDPDPQIRDLLKERLANEGLASLLLQLSELDPLYFSQVDKKNPARVIRGLEVCLSAGKPFSSFRKRQKPVRNFSWKLICLELPREELYARIDFRVDQMMEQGLLKEAEELYPYRNMSALNTVGYRELFDFFEDKFDINEAIRLIKRNTRHYARRQITWNNRYEGITRFSPVKPEEIISFCEKGS